MSNHKTHQLKTAMKQFLEDLKTDPDFIEHKKNCKIDSFFSYGVIVSAYKRYLSQRKDKTETLIVNHLKLQH
jgi:hypothetical protein